MPNPNTTNNNFVGNVFMIAGCAMGAGCLALPMLAAGPNFIFSIIFLLLLTFFSYHLATTLLEIVLVYKSDINNSSIIASNFGRTGVVIGAIINGALMYALLAVYMTGGADVLRTTIFPLFHAHLSHNTALLIFLLVFIPIFFKGTEVVVKANELVFYIKLLSFLLVVFTGIHFLSPAIINFIPSQIVYIPGALVVFFGSVWFHFLIPVIARINNYERKLCHKIFICGLLLPVILYILWIAVMLSLIPRDGSGNTFFSLLRHKESVGTMISYAMHNNPHISSIMKISLSSFSNIALLTSFLTVGISTYDYIRDALKIKQNYWGIILNLILTFIPGSLFAALFPNGFVFVLKQAIFLLMLTNILVLLCCIKEYGKIKAYVAYSKIYVLLCGLLILIVCQVLDNFSLLPQYTNMV